MGRRGDAGTRGRGDAEEPGRRTRNSGLGTRRSGPRTQDSSPSTQHPAPGSRIRRAAVIVAAGRGTRMGEDKVWLPLGGIPVVAYSLEAFAACPDVEMLVLVVGRDRLEDGRELAARLGISASVTEGGERRQDSVRRGLSLIGEAEIVAIHDGARPLVSPELIEVCYRAAERDGAAVPGIPLRDTVKRVSADGWVVETVDREGLWSVQTPQVFRAELIRRAYEALDGEVTDDAAAVEMMGHPVRVVPGDPLNVKLTTREDLEVARALVDPGARSIAGRGRIPRGLAH